MIQNNVLRLESIDDEDRLGQIVIPSVIWQDQLVCLCWIDDLIPQVEAAHQSDTLSLPRDLIKDRLVPLWATEIMPQNMRQVAAIR